MTSTAKAPRVLFFSHETTWSGAPIQLLHLVTWLKNRGWDVSVAVPKPTVPESGPIFDKLRQIGTEVFPLLDSSVTPDLAELRSLCGQFDIVVANTLTMWAAVRAAHEEGVAVIWYIHENLVAQHLLAQIPEIQPALALADLLVLPTHRTAQLYTPLTYRPVEVLPYGIPVANNLTKTTRENSTVFSFLLLGTYESRKGQDVFLEAIAQMPAPERDRAVFRTAGRKLDQKFYQALARQAADLPNVELLDGLEHDEARAAIAAADVLVCSSRDETMPIAILEAMSLEKAIVSADVGGITEWLCDGVNALIVPAEDSQTLANAMRRCLEDSELLATLGANARQTFSENFSIDRLGERFTRLIERVTSATS
jgi:glycosyltransferase involved in cell wall biosynthesis